MTELALGELQPVYAFIYTRVGNVADAEDLTQQVALKALHRLREGSSVASVRAYLFATARSVLASFWSGRLRHAELELSDDVPDAGPQAPVEAAPQTAAWLERTLSSLPSHYRTVLELRFLHACSLKETAAQMGRSVGAIKLMQMRALHSAAHAMGPDPITSPRQRPPARLLP